MTATRRREARSAPSTPPGTPWPAPAGEPSLVLAFASASAEREVLSRWLADNNGTPGRVEILDRPDARLEQALADARADDPYIVPLRVEWLPRARNGRRAAGLADVLAFSNPRRPGPRLQAQILRHEPDRCRVLAAAPARLTELQKRFDANPDQDGFPAFVSRQAQLALARAERLHAGLQYKVPRLVVEELEASAAFNAKLAQLAHELGRPEAEVAQEASGYLHEMAASHSRLAIDAWGEFGRWLSRAYQVEVDEQEAERIRQLSHRYPLAFLPSHRSYLDPLVLRTALHRQGFAPNHVLGGLNVSFWPIGPWARRSGVVFIRRSVRGEPVYKLVLREYIGYLVRKRFNVEWYIEGGRTRTGKLRPPRYGLLNYLVEAFKDGAAQEVMLIPTSIVYDQLYEVGAMAAEEHGAQKTPESLGWLVGYARAQGRGFGKVRIRFGEPLPLGEALAEIGESEHEVERLAFEVCHRINAATPITETALVALALLGVDDRALTLAQVTTTLAPLLEYVRTRRLPTTGGLDLTTEQGLRQALDALGRHGVVRRFDGGIEPVWSIAAERHLEAAFYRNSIVHLLVNRAIAELVLVHVDEQPTDDPVSTGWEEALRIRDVLKFEFFFASKRDFDVELREELALVDPDWSTRNADPGAAWAGLERAGVLLAPRALASFLEAYLVVAEGLVALSPTAPIDEPRFLAECLGVGHQYRLQGKLATTESISRELFATALKLARNRGLVEPAQDGVHALVREREAFRDEIGTLLRRIARLRELELARLPR
ncbi:MAG TPA: glycerol-3-phosphate 1-O-acyltransferase [Solirubrobacteraceae bacterium]|nr:glycerol-3-phosphate 1-O-acyltransferase [Solirubrobacteraceae bacterium]